MKSRKTPALRTGVAVIPSWSPDSEIWSAIGKDYCSEAHALMLAVRARELKGRAESSQSMTDRAALTQKAQQAALTFQKVAGKKADMREASATGLLFQRQIARATNRLISSVAFEEAAPPVAPAAKWLARLEKAAMAFVSAVEAPLDGLSKSMARADAERHLKAIMREAGRRTVREDWGKSIIGSEMRLRDIAALAADVAASTKLAMQDIAKEKPIRTGDSWDIWAIDVGKICDDYGFPTTAANRPVADGDFSPFVKFLAALQDTWPDSARSSRKGKGADLNLAKAINDAPNRAQNQKKPKD